MTEQQSSTPSSGDGAEPGDPQPMNRAERRAAAKGKKAGPSGGHGAPLSPNAHMSRPGGAAGQIRLPRTGHKGG